MHRVWAGPEREIFRATPRKRWNGHKNGEVPGDYLEAAGERRLIREGQLWQTERPPALASGLSNFVLTSIAR